MTRTISEKEQLLNLLTDFEVGTNVFTYEQRFEKSNEPELMLLFELLYSSLADMTIRNFNCDCFLALILKQKIDNYGLGLDCKSALQKAIEHAKKLEVNIPKILSQYNTGHLGFHCYTADKKITFGMIQELLEFIEVVITDFIGDLNVNNSQT